MDFQYSDDFDSLMDADDFDSLDIMAVNRPITVTRFPNNYPKTMMIRQMTLAQIGAEITQAPPVATKDDLPDYQLATFSGALTDRQCLRSNDAVLTVSGCRLDYDEGAISFDEAVARLTKAKIAALVLSTSSDQMPGKGHRWRIFAMFSRNLPASEYRQMVARIDALFDNTLDPASYTVSQPMYSGAVIGGNPMRSAIVHGRPIDTADDLAVELNDAESWRTCAPDSVLTDTDEGQKRLAREHIEAWIDKLAIENETYLQNGTADTNKTLFQAAATAGSLAAHGLINHDWARDLLVTYARQTCKMRTAKSTFRSGWKNGILKPMAERYVRMIVGYSDVEVQIWYDELDELDRDWVDEMNAKHAVVRLKGKTYIASLQRNGAYDFGPTADLHTWYANDLMKSTPPGGKKPTYSPRSEAWMKSKRRLGYEGGVDFLPSGKCPVDTLNLWTGWAVEPKPDASCARILDHIRDVIAGGNDEHARYICGWLAHLIQYPEDKPGVALVLRGQKGSGKDTLGDYMRHVIGRRHAPKVNSTNHLVGRFNAHFEAALLLHVEEGSWAGNREAENVLKSVVTADVMPIEHKGINIAQVRSFMRLLITSNNEWVVPASGDERRWAVFNVPSTRCDDHDYFKALRAEMKGDGPAALFHYLKHYDLADFNVRMAPVTEGLRDQIEASLRGFNKWWRSYLTGGVMPTGSIDHDGDWSGTAVTIDATELRHRYDTWRRDQRFGAEPLEQAQFGKALRDVCPSVKTTQPRSNNRARMYVIPKLAEARAEFEKTNFKGMPCDWG